MLCGVAVRVMRRDRLVGTNEESGADLLAQLINTGANERPHPAQREP